MYCDRCGAQLNDTENFCPKCGKTLKAGTLMPAQNRIVGHVRLLGIFWIAISAFRLLPGLFLVAMFRNGMSMLPPEVPDFVHGILQVVGVCLLGAAIAGLAAGWGLLQRQPWARMLAIVLGFLNLIDIPLGTALGIYTLWVLLPAKSEQDYRAVMRAA